MIKCAVSIHIFKILFMALHTRLYFE
uniref:Uncharacterized protein n=1 Tax=Anguilla anguilla TaxID=7936 RepID=A0A0E9RHT8_ANGAN